LVAIKFPFVVVVGSGMLVGVDVTPVVGEHATKTKEIRDNKMPVVDFMIASLKDTTPLSLGSG